MNLEVKCVSGAQLEPYLDGLGALRISVFRDWPYLYDGSLEYEREYLQRYLKSERSLVALVLAEGSVVGATTCMPMAEEGPEFQAAFLSAGHDLKTICYLGESILLSPYRGRGLGKKFFQLREEHAKQIGCQWTAFCAVDRSPDDLRCPPNYRPLNPFWLAQGYVMKPELRATLGWKEVGVDVETSKTLTFWMKEHTYGD